MWMSGSAATQKVVGSADLPACLDCINHGFEVSRIGKHIRIRQRRITGIGRGDP
jgi:hypothetical protein